MLSLQSTVLFEASPTLLSLWPASLGHALSIHPENTDALQRVLTKTQPGRLLLRPDHRYLQKAWGALALARRLRPDLPCIFFTNVPDAQEAVTALKAGAWEYVKTPQSVEALQNELQTLASTQPRWNPQEEPCQLFQMVQNLPGILFVIGNNLRFQFLSDGAKRLLGFHAREILQAPRAFFKRIAPKDRDTFRKALRNAFDARDKSFDLEFHFQHRDGYQVFLRAESVTRNAPMQNSFTVLEGIITDITRQSYLEQVLLQNERLNTVRTMTQEVAHELRNPLVSLGSAVRHLKTLYPKEPIVRVLQEDCLRLESLTYRMEDFLHLGTPVMTACSLAATVNFALHMFDNRLKRTGIHCTVHLPDNLPYISGDQDFLHRIFVHILLQALTVLQHGSTLSLHASSAQGFVLMHITLEPVWMHLPEPHSFLTPFAENRKHVNLAACYQCMDALKARLELVQESNKLKIILTFPACRHNALLPPFVF